MLITCADVCFRSSRELKEIECAAYLEFQFSYGKWSYKATFLRFINQPGLVFLDVRQGLTVITSLRRCFKAYSAVAGLLYHRS
jgi:hypothetical protein